MVVDSRSFEGGDTESGGEAMVEEREVCFESEMPEPFMMRPMAKQVELQGEPEERRRQ